MKNLLQEFCCQARASGRIRLALLAPAIALALGAGTIAAAQTAHAERPKAKKAAPAADASAPAGAAGQQASIDPQTGQLRQPTPGEARRLSESMKKQFNRSPEKLNVVQLPDGTQMVELTEEYMDVMVVKLNADGTLSTECVTGTQAANAMVEAAAKTTGNTAQAAPAAAATTAGKSTRKATTRTTRKAAKKSTPAARKE